jgi:hypothetical protein
MKIGDRFMLGDEYVEVTSVMGKNYAYKPVAKEAEKEVAKTADAPKRRSKKEA